MQPRRSKASEHIGNGKGDRRSIYVGGQRKRTKGKPETGYSQSRRRNDNPGQCGCLQDLDDPAKHTQRPFGTGRTTDLRRSGIRSRNRITNTESKCGEKILNTRNMGKILKEPKRHTGKTNGGRANRT